MEHLCPLFMEIHRSSLFSAALVEQNLSFQHSRECDVIAIHELGMLSQDLLEFSLIENYEQ